MRPPVSNRQGKPVGATRGSLGQHMADVEFEDIDAAGPVAPAGGAQRLISIAGALTSLALVVGVGVWGYKLAARDVNGVPVVRALEGPMRVAPTDPGGEIAAHMGLAVNAIAAEGAAEPPPERLVLAPRPVDLNEEDVPGATVAAAGEAAAAPVAAPEAVAVGEVAVAAEAVLAPDAVVVAEPVVTELEPVTPVAPVEMPTETVAADPTADAVALALAEALSEGVEPLSSTGADPAADAGTEPEAAAPPGALTRSPRPLRRPEGGAAPVVLAAAGTTASAAPTVAKQIDPASIAAGTRLVQLGAYDDEADALAEWDRLVAQFGDLIAGKSRVIQSAQSGGRSFVRLRAYGFADEDDARRFCSALLAENAACIPVAHRP